jgi:hypothetical protein
MRAMLPGGSLQRIVGPARLLDAPRGGRAAPFLRPFPHVARDHHKVERLGEAALIARIHLTAPTTDDFAPRCTDQTERWEPWRRGT